MCHEHENITFLLNATYTKILIYIEKKLKKCLGPGPRAPYGSYAYGRALFQYKTIFPGIRNPIMKID